MNHHTDISIRPATASEWARAAGDVPRPWLLEALVITFRDRGRPFSYIVVTDQPLDGTQLVRLASELRQAV